MTWRAAGGAVGERADVVADRLQVDPGLAPHGRSVWQPEHRARRVRPRADERRRRHVRRRAPPAHPPGRARGRRRDPASSGSSPCASSAPQAPDRTSPEPAVASAGDPVPLTRAGPSGPVTTVASPLSSTVDAELGGEPAGAADAVGGDRRAEALELAVVRREQRRRRPAPQPLGVLRADRQPVGVDEHRDVAARARPRPPRRRSRRCPARGRRPRPAPARRSPRRRPQVGDEHLGPAQAHLLGRVRRAGEADHAGAGDGGRRRRTGPRRRGRSASRRRPRRRRGCTCRSRRDRGAAAGRRRRPAAARPAPAAARAPRPMSTSSTRPAASRPAPTSRPGLQVPNTSGEVGAARPRRRPRRCRRRPRSAGRRPPRRRRRPARPGQRRPGAARRVRRCPTQAVDDEVGAARAAVDDPPAGGPEGREGVRHRLRRSAPRSPPRRAARGGHRRAGRRRRCRRGPTSSSTRLP